MSEPGRILTLDYGTVRIGLAISDPLRMIAKPLKVLPNNGFKNIVTALEAEIAAQCITLLIIGMPYSIDGGNTAKTDETAKFISKLGKCLNVPVETWDERYSSAEAEAELKKMGYTWQESKELRDAMAAAMILRSYLDSKI